MRHRLFWILCGLLICCPVGCGPKLCEVTGKVTYNGEELKEEGCKIAFLGPQGQQVVAPVAPNGDYKAIGVVAGENKVAVFYSRSPSEAKPRTRGPTAKAENNNPLLNLPLKYADVNTSGFTVTVDTGTKFDADLEGNPLK